MVIFQILLQVKPEFTEAFREACAANGRGAISSEPGCLRFDVFQDVEDPTKFTLFEIYASEEALQAHRETEHYQTWKSGTADMIVERMRHNWNAVQPIEFKK